MVHEHSNVPTSEACWVPWPIRGPLIPLLPRVWPPSTSRINSVLIVVFKPPLERLQPPLLSPISHCTIGLGHKGCGGGVLGTPCALSASPTPFHPSWSPRLRVNGGLPGPRRWEQSFSSCAWTWSALLDGAGYPCTVHVCHTTFVHRAEVGLVATDAWSPARTREGSGL